MERFKIGDLVQVYALCKIVVHEPPFLGKTGRISQISRFEGHNISVIFDDIKYPCVYDQNEIQLVDANEWIPKVGNLVKVVNVCKAISIMAHRCHDKDILQQVGIIENINDIEILNHRILIRFKNNKLLYGHYSKAELELVNTWLDQNKRKPWIEEIQNTLVDMKKKQEDQFLIIDNQKRRIDLD
ncbi:hypothetical protein HYS94_02115 [Candidatus Daviesbacteria bacterium]|nr:hypothetical protein [Candidatus Daviesbacteria bacterium]